jgi:membrane protein insertase Oxa1/YidC/SpoIIIJ
MTGTIKPAASLTESQKTSAYFAEGDGYDKDFYENDLANWGKIVGMLVLFYIFNAFHWWANFELGVAHAEASTLYNLLIFALTVAVIGVMLAVGSVVNKKKVTHEFYVEKISEEKQRQAEAEAKRQAKEANLKLIQGTGA